MVNSSGIRRTAAATYVLDQCEQLELAVRWAGGGANTVRLVGPAGEAILVRTDGRGLGIVEQLLRQLRFDFAALPLLVCGESKEVRLLTPRVTIAKLLPTVYSFTHQRYGEAPGTDAVRARFCAALFREMARAPGAYHLANAFLGLVESPHGPLLVEHRVMPGNVEVRVKRYHIGSPVHRYRYVSQHPTARGGAPLGRWQRFDTPLVCFDWRHPMTDEDGRALADEPLPDDYAALWIDDIAGKRLARDTFGWIEQLFARKGLRLIDICFFIDAAGRAIFGEISPDCMRVRSDAADGSDALDKDEWRSGGDAATVLRRYRRLATIVFGDNALSDDALSHDAPCEQVLNEAA